jgi:hypothetical protein
MPVANTNNNFIIENTNIKKIYLPVTICVSTYVSYNIIVRARASLTCITSAFIYVSIMFLCV